MAAPTKVQFAGTTFRSFIEYLTQRQQLEAVIVLVSPETAALFEKTILPTSWVDGQVLSELCGAVATLGGEEAIRAMTYETTRTNYAPLVGRLIETLLSLFGATPETLFSRLESLTGNFERGTTWGYTALGPREGIIELKLAEPVGPATFAAWEGIFQVGFELTRHKGTVGERQLLSRNKGARWKVSW